MLEPNQRRLLLDALRPPDGYQLDRAIGTTFGLDLEALLFVPLAFTFFQWEDADGEPTKDPLALLEALRRHAQSLSIFCEAGYISVPPKQQPLHAALEGSVVEVRAPIKGGRFHPKVWTLRFVGVDDEGETQVRYRVLVMSRNLTMSNSWDLMLTLEGVLGNRKKAISLNHPLADFIAALPGMALHQVPKRVVEDSTLIASEVRRVRFDPPPGVNLVAFWPLGLGGRRTQPFQGRLDRMLVVSPFLSSNWLRPFLASHPSTLLVSREEELHKLEPEVLELAGDCRFLGIPDPEPLEPTDDAPTTAPTELGGLHAKLFVADAGWNARAWIGSANATGGGFGINVEFMVEVEGTKSQLGIDALVNADADSGGFGSLLRNYEAPEDQGAPDLAEEARRVSEEIRAQIAAAGLIVTVKAAPEQADSYVMTLELGEGNGRVDSNLNVLAWPASLGSGHASRLMFGKRGAVARFDSLSLLDLTAFFGFEVSNRDRSDLPPVRFALNLPISGLPEDRQKRLLRAMLSDPDRVARYLLMLLALDGTGGISPGMGLVDLGSSSHAGAWQLTQAGLFEALLGVLRDDPGRLKHVAALVRDLVAQPNGAGLLPEGFAPVWDAVWSAAEQSLVQ